MKEVLTKQVIHEINPHGQHRIVVLNPDGTNEQSEWMPVEQVANLGSLFASADPSSPLPAHVFTAREVPAQVVV